MKHADLHCWASLPVRHWCGNSHLRVIMGWLAPQVWDPGADSLGSRKRERESERGRGGEKICTLNRRMSHSLHPSNSLCSVSFSVSSSRSPLLTYLLHYLGVLNICCFLSWSFWLSLWLFSSSLRLSISLSPATSVWQLKSLTESTRWIWAKTAHVHLTW